MSKIHFEIRNEETPLSLTDCICKKVPFPKLTDDWNEVTCKYCLKLKDSYSYYHGYGNKGGNQ